MPVSTRCTYTYRQYCIPHSVSMTSVDLCTVDLYHMACDRSTESKATLSVTVTLSVLPLSGIHSLLSFACDVCMYTLYMCFLLRTTKRAAA